MKSCGVYKTPVNDDGEKEVITNYCNGENPTKYKIIFP